MSGLNTALISVTVFFLVSVNNRKSAVMSPNVAVTISSSPHIPRDSHGVVAPIELEREEQKLLEHVCAAYSDEICNDMLNTDRGPVEFSRKYIPELLDLLTSNQPAPGEFLGAVLAWEAKQPQGPANEMARLFHIMVIFVLAGSTAAFRGNSSIAFETVARNPGYRRKLGIIVAMAEMHKAAMVQFIKDNPGCAHQA